MAKATPAAIALYGKTGAFEMSRVPRTEFAIYRFARNKEISSHLSSEFLVYFYYELVHYIIPKWMFRLMQLICQM